MESPQAAMLTRITRFIILAPLEGDLHSISFSKMNKNTEIRMHQLHNLPLTHVDVYFISFQNQLKSFPPVLQQQMSKRTGAKVLLYDQPFCK